MQVKQFVLHTDQWSSPLQSMPNAQLVLAFGDRTLVKNHAIQTALEEHFPNAQRIGCTTSGEIAGAQVYDAALVVTAIEFEKTPMACTHIQIDDFENSIEAAARLAEGLLHDDLRYVLLISDGQKVNGSELVDGLKRFLPSNVLITGGLAGDDSRFQETIVWHNEQIASGLVVMVGFYGDALTIGHGSLGGWDTFGPSRLITGSQANKLFTLDNESALALYKTYLGDYADQLPASALLFPLAVSQEEEGDYVVRTILNVDEAEQSMTFAGDMPEGWYAQLMRANVDRLIDGAQLAAEAALTPFKSVQPDFALLISCVGRRLVLGQRVEEELEEVQSLVGERCIAAGFYSYGEVSPLQQTMDCRLHNQTMTITTFSER